MSYDEASFKAGFALGRALWRPHRKPGSSTIPAAIKELVVHTGYTIQWNGENSFTLRWIDNIPSYAEDEGVVLNSGLGTVTITANAPVGCSWQYGTCTTTATLNRIIGYGEGRLTYTDAGNAFTATLTSGANNCVFCGTVFAQTSGNIRSLTISWTGGGS